MFIRGGVEGGRGDKHQHLQLERCAGGYELKIPK